MGPTDSVEKVPFIKEFYRLDDEELQESHMAFIQNAVTFHCIYPSKLSTSQQMSRLKGIPPKIYSLPRAKSAAPSWTLRGDEDDPKYQRRFSGIVSGLQVHAWGLQPTSKWNILELNFASRSLSPHSLRFVRRISGTVHGCKFLGPNAVLATSWILILMVTDSVEVLL